MAFWCFTHIGIKGIERVAPSVAYGDSLGSVILERIVVGVQASLLHGRPLVIVEASRFSSWLISHPGKYPTMALFASHPQCLQYELALVGHIGARLAALALRAVDDRQPQLEQPCAFAPGQRVRLGSHRSR